MRQCTISSVMDEQLAARPCAASSIVNSLTSPDKPPCRRVPCTVGKDQTSAAYGGRKVQGDQFVCCDQNATAMNTGRDNSQRDLLTDSHVREVEGSTPCGDPEEPGAGVVHFKTERGHTGLLPVDENHGS